MKMRKEIGSEIAKFMRGEYRLDESTGMFYDVPCLKFRQGKKTIVSINFRPDSYEFQIIFGKAEREKFEAIKHEFPAAVRELYEQARTLHDGKWLFVDVRSFSDWETVRKLILIKKKPNRKALSKENALYGKCGHRCDLCVHYADMDEDFRNSLIPHLNAVYGEADWAMRCTGCDTPGCQCKAEGTELCDPLKCLNQNGLSSCFDCSRYPCEQATVGYRELEPKSISADDVTWAILPYVPHQYER